MNGDVEHWFRFVFAQTEWVNLDVPAIAIFFLGLFYLRHSTLLSAEEMLQLPGIVLRVSGTADTDLQEGLLLFSANCFLWRKSEYADC